MEQSPSSPDEAPQEPSPADEQPAGDRPQGAARQAGASGEELDQKGTAVLQALQRVAKPYVMGAGGKGDIPWVEVSPEHLVEVAKRCRDHRSLQMQMLHCLLAVDYKESIQVVYILFSIAKRHKAMLKVNLPADAPKVPSVAGLWDGAGWHERETHDLYGVEFEGNPDLSPLLLYEGFEGHPGLKSFPFHEYEEF